MRNGKAASSCMRTIFRKGKAAAKLHSVEPDHPLIESIFRRSRTSHGQRLIQSTHAFGRKASSSRIHERDHDRMHWLRTGIDTSLQAPAKTLSQILSCLSRASLMSCPDFLHLMTRTLQNLPRILSYPPVSKGVLPPSKLPCCRPGISRASSLPVQCRPLGSRLLPCV